VRSHTTKMGEIAMQGFRPQICKTCFVFLLSMQRGFSATYPAPISTIFETTDVNRFPHAYTQVKKFKFPRRVFSKSQNSPKYGTLGWCASVRHAAKTAQLWAMGIISGASQHPKDVPFVREFWWGTYGLGAISPRKSQTFGDFMHNLS